MTRVVVAAPRATPIAPFGAEGQEYGVHRIGVLPQGGPYVTANKGLRGGLRAALDGREARPWNNSSST